MQRINIKKFPDDHLKSLAAKDDIAALQDFKTNYPDIFLHQLTNLAFAGSAVILPGIEQSVVKHDRSHHLLMHAILGDREALQAEFDRTPANKKLSAKLLMIEGSARAGDIEFAEALAATFPSGFDIEDDDEKISDIMARICIMRGVAQNATLSHGDRMTYINSALHTLILDLDKLDYDFQDRESFQYYAYEHIIMGFYLSGVFELRDQLYKTITSLNYISLRCHLSKVVDEYHRRIVNTVTFSECESIRGTMLKTQCDFETAKQAYFASKNEAHDQSMRLFAYKADKLDPLRKCYSVKLR